MRILSLAIMFLFLVITGRRQDSPHGSDFRVSCKECHSAKGWELDREIYSFDHSKTRLPLEGQHTFLECKACHPTLVFSEAETDCISCHTDMHNQTVGLDCARCHTPHSWIVNNITDVHRQGRFPLQGPHMMAQCLDCHPSASLLEFEPVGIECIDCHMQDYQSATDPNHVLGNFSSDCFDCHSMSAFTWAGQGFDHSFFPLTQGHAIFDCNQCHTGTEYANISSECYSCHEDDYKAAANPNHLAANFSIQCLECHTTLPGWKPAQFDHSFFPLTLGHAINDCNQCHDPSNYSNVSTDCFSCHEADYNTTTNPNHLTAGINNVCMDCHTTNPGWKPATFTEHDGLFFPIYSGEHRGTWNSCTDCHENPANYSVFSCLDCHEHSRANMDDEHSDVNGYIYSSVACLDCHPTGSHE
ncbi:MAG: cytochrome c3 family protein [Bacteroidota bacterium]